MRQAGRYLPEYREVRARAGSFLNLCYAPDDAAEVTLQPLRRFDLDAAIVFSDILVVPHALGSALDFVENEGPVLSRVGSMADVMALGSGAGAWQFDRVYETLARVRSILEDHHSLIGFCGAPWTVASYMVEGRGSDRKSALAVAAEGPEWFQRLIDLLVEASIGYLVGQVRAGADAVQIFDSWAGDLPEGLRGKWVVDPIQRVIAGVRAQCADVPVIVFARGVAGGHAAVATGTGASAISVEETVDIAAVLATLPAGMAVQGNLSPRTLLEGGPGMVEAVKGLCAAVPRGRHVFNLGHGIQKETPPEHVAALVRAVREMDSVA
jgi:uroporphyrinogen decarboxylase